MENQILIAAINEAIQKAVPAIVEEVSQKLNREQTKNSRKERWENLTLEDIKKLSTSSDYRDRCRAASHPKATSDILSQLEGDSDKRVASAIFRIKEKNYINRMKNIGVLDDLIWECQFGAINKMRSIAREFLKKKLFAGEFDNEIEKRSPYRTFSFSGRVSDLIKQSKNSDHNTSYFAKLMLEYRFMCLRKTLTEEENLLLDYSFKNLNKNHE